MDVFANMTEGYSQHQNDASFEETEVCIWCNKTFKKRGMKIHYAKSECGKFYLSESQSRELIVKSSPPLTGTQERKRRPFLVSQKSSRRRRTQSENDKVKSRLEAFYLTIEEADPTASTEEEKSLEEGAGSRNKSEAKPPLKDDESSDDGFYQTLDKVEPSPEHKNSSEEDVYLTIDNLTEPTFNHQDELQAIQKEESISQGNGNSEEDFFLTIDTTESKQESYLGKNETLMPTEGLEQELRETNKEMSTTPDSVEKLENDFSQSSCKAYQMNSSVNFIQENLESQLTKDDEFYQTVDKVDLPLEDNNSSNESTHQTIDKPKPILNHQDEPHTGHREELMPQENDKSEEENDECQIIKEIYNGNHAPKKSPALKGGSNKMGKSDNYQKKITNWFSSEPMQDRTAKDVERESEKVKEPRKGKTLKENNDKVNFTESKEEPSREQCSQVNEWIVLSEWQAEEDPVLSISKEEIEELKAIVLNGEDKEELVNRSLVVRRHDLKSLYKDQWVNDAIVEEYFNLIVKDRPSMTSLTTYLFSKLISLGVEEGFKDCNKWVKEDLTLKEQIFVPISYKSHWSLIMILPEHSKIWYFDSLIGSRKSSPAPKVMKKYMEMYFREKGKPKTFTIQRAQSIPRQFNGLDCGVFTCQYGERLARGAYMEFKQADMPNMRWKMIWEILYATIKPRITISVKKKAPLIQQSSHSVQGKVEQKANNIVTENNKEENKSKGQKKSDSGGRILECEHKEHPEKTKKFIKWPQLRSKEWDKLDIDLAGILQGIGKTAEEKADLHPRLIHTVCMERFGVEKLKKNGNPSRRQSKSAKLREDLININRDLVYARPREKKYLLRKKEETIHNLRLQKRAEGIRRRRIQKSRNTREFYKQPYKFARNLLDPEVKGNLESSQKEVEDFLEKAHSDKERDTPLEEIDGLYSFPEPENKYNCDPPSWKEFKNVLRHAKMNSAPGPNGVPYKLYKNCPRVANILYNYLREMWVQNKVAKSWRRAEGVLIPKEHNATQIERFRTISLLNVEGKIFFKMKADKITAYLLENNYIDTRIQKGGVPGISGCLEHTAIVTQMIREAIRNKWDLVETWLDIKNAYGSIPHKLINLALEKTHLPEDVISIVKNYYEDVQIRFTTPNFTTKWQKLERGIVTGCTLSVPLFALTMTMLLLSTRKETKGPKVKSGQQQENARLYMDDITTTTRTPVQTNHLLKEIARFFSWARLEVKPEKCRALVIKKGKVINHPIMYNNQQIKPIQEEPVKYLGKVYNKTCNDQDNIAEIGEKVKTGLKTIDKANLPGKCKAWILENLLLPRLMWPISIYTIAMTKIEEWQKQITSMLKKWLGLPKNLSTDMMYSKTSKVQLPYSSLVEEAKVSKVRNLSTLRSSKDEGIRNANIVLDAGRKWKPSEAHDRAVSKLKLQEIAGIGNRGKEGLGLNQRRYYSKAHHKERRGMICDEVRAEEEDQRRVKATSFSKQGANLQWETNQKKMNHKEIMNMSESRLKFIMKSVHDLLGTPANKNKWFKTQEFHCKICGGNGTLAHILSGCKVSLAQGRYTWRHNRVLKEIAYWVEEKRKQNNAENPAEPRYIKFVKSGQKGERTQLPNQSFLRSARDWKLQVDLGKRVRIPDYIVLTRLKPDLILTSESTKQMILMELTVPFEDNMEIAAELKRTKYEQLVEETKKSHWNTMIWTVEVGCRGFSGSSLSRFIKELGYGGKEKAKIIKKVEAEAENASHMLWNWSHMKEWGNSE